MPGACATHTNAALDELLAASFDGTVILSSMGPVYLTDIPFKGQGRARVRGQGVVLVDNPGVTDRWEIFETGLRNTLAELSQIEDVRVVVALDVPELGIRHGCNRLSKTVDLGFFELERDFGDVATYCRITREEYDRRTEEYRNLIFEVTAEFDKARVFDPSEIFCDSDYCYGYLPDWGYLYRDADHLSHNGSLFFASGMASLLNELEAVRSAPGSLADDGR